MTSLSIHIAIVAVGVSIIAGWSSPVSAWMGGARPRLIHGVPPSRKTIHSSTTTLNNASTSTSTSTNTNSNSLEDNSHWLDYLKFDGQTPTFDVIEKTKEYTSTAGYKAFSLKDIPSDYYSDEYIFRGPVVGPINRQDLVDVNGWFGLQESFPDLDRQVFGFTVDPENPFRVLFFERWKATNTGKMLGIVEPTNEKCVTPVMPFSIVWTPEGKIIYEHLTTAVDRFEGNTKGKVAVFGLFEKTNLRSTLPDNNIGNKLLIFLQKMNRNIPYKAQTYSKKADVPSWWKSEAVAAEPNDI